MRQVRVILTILLGIFLVYSLLPLYYVMVSSTKADGTLFSSFGLWFSGRFALWDNLVLTFTYGNGIFGRWLWNTLWYSVLSAVGSALFATAAGYAFAKYQFRGRRAFFAIIPGSIMIHGTALVIPTFLLLSNMGLVNTPRAVILPSLTTPLGVFLMRVYADSAVPDRADRCGADRRGWRVHHSDPDRVPADGARLHHGAAAVLCRRSEQLFPAPGHAVQ
ncbi:carbohydrate ABC transporter permease [Devosia sp. A8/3-2]|nr:carbohydrate ABC transporter permease [Devosia sp. A8/3-2]